MAYSDTGREKQSGRHETSLISRYWNRRQSRRPRLRRYFRPCSAACAIRAPGENWRAAENRTASTAPWLDGTDRLTSRRGAAAGPPDSWVYSGRDWWAV